MKIDITLTSNLSYFFCGSISLKRYNNKENPLTIDLEKLTKQEKVGLVRSVKTGVISVLSGKEHYEVLAQSLNKKKEEAPVEVKVEEEVTSEVTSETIVETVIEEITEEETKVQVKEEKEIEEEKKITKPTTPRSAPRKRVTTAK